MSLVTALTPGHYSPHSQMSPPGGCRHGDMSPRHRSCTHSGVKTLNGHYDDDTHLTLETGDQVPGEDGQWSLMYDVCSLWLRLWCCVTGLCRTSAGPSVQSQPSCDSGVQCVSVSVARAADPAPTRRHRHHHNELGPDQPQNLPIVHWHASDHQVGHWDSRDR